MPTHRTAASVDFPVTDLHRLRREVARHAGFAAATADHFADAGTAQAGPVSVSLTSLLPDGEGPLLLGTSAQRPPHIEDAAWDATLLMMNAESYVLMPGAFGLDADGRAWLVMRLDGPDREPFMVSTWLQGAVQLWLNLLSDAKPADTPVATSSKGETA